MTKPIDLTAVVADLVKRVGVLEEKLLESTNTRPISRNPGEINVNLPPLDNTRDSRDRPTSEKPREPLEVIPEVIVEESVIVRDSLQ
jgi:hypothetical protein